MTAADPIEAARGFAEALLSIVKDQQRRLVRANRPVNIRPLDTVELTPREQEIFDLLVWYGHCNKEIGARLRLSDRTVKHYMTSIMSKYGVTSRVHLVMKYHGVGKIE